MPERSIAHDMPAEHAAMSIHVAVADFVVAVVEARTTDDALKIHHLIAEARCAIEAAESAALNRADALCGERT